MHLRFDAAAQKNEHGIAERAQGTRADTDRGQGNCRPENTAGKQGTREKNCHRGYRRTRGKSALGNAFQNDTNPGELEQKHHRNRCRCGLKREVVEETHRTGNRTGNQQNRSTAQKRGARR